MRCNLVPYNGPIRISDTITPKTKEGQKKGILRADKGKILIETDRYIIYSSKINNEVYKKKNIL